MICLKQLSLLEFGANIMYFKNTLKMDLSKAKRDNAFRIVKDYANICVMQCLVTSVTFLGMHSRPIARNFEGGVFFVVQCQHEKLDLYGPFCLIRGVRPHRHPHG